MDRNEIETIDEVFIELKNNITLREQGKFPGIPYYEIYPRFGVDFPSLEKGHQGMLTASSGIGKTNWWIEMILFQISLLYFSKLNKGEKPGFKPKFLIALLENTKAEFKFRLLSRIYAFLSGEVLPAKMLKGKDSLPAPKHIIEEYEERATKMANSILNLCVIIDNVSNPTGLYKWARTQSELLGKHIKRDETFIEDGKETKVKVYDHYEPNDPEEHVILIMDNANNLATEKGADTERLAIKKWYRDYGRLQICKHWQWTIVNIHQQASDTEKEEFNFGKSVTSKVKPTTAGLGNNKEVQRDCHFIWGLFNPSKHKIDDYEKYPTVKFKNYFRSLLLLKQNDGIADVEYPFYVHYGASIMREAPKVSELTEDIINKISKGKYKNKG